MPTNLAIAPMTDEKENPISVYGLNYKKTPVELREKLSLCKEEYAPALQALVSNGGIDEAVIVSTCNRVEFVTACSAKLKANEQVLENLVENISGISKDIFSADAYSLKGSRAVSHVFKVAAGLDSMVIGEPQILGQLKDAFRLAQEEGVTSVYLNRLFQRAFGVAKEIRSSTKIGQNAVSVCYAAKELAQQIFGDLRDAKVLLLGAGDMGGLALQHFRSAGVSSLYIANKTLANASELADRFSAIPLSLSQVSQVISDVDIVIGACSLKKDDDHVISEDLALEASRERLGKTQFYIDLGVPRNFDSKISELSDAFLYTIDDLEAVVSNNLGKRMLEVKRAELIVDVAVEKYQSWLEQRAFEPTIKALRDKMIDHQKFEIEKTIKRLKKSSLSEDELRAALEDMSLALISKTLHQPISHIKKSASAGENITSLIRDFFLGYSK